MEEQNGKGKAVKAVGVTAGFMALFSNIHSCTAVRGVATWGDDVIRLAATQGDDVVRLATTQGDDVVRLATTQGDDVVRLATTQGDDVVRLAATQGDDVIGLVTGQGDDATNLIAKYGDDAKSLIAKYGDDATNLIAKYGDDALKSPLRAYPLGGSNVVVYSDNVVVIIKPNGKLLIGRSRHIAPRFQTITPFQQLDDGIGLLAQDSADSAALNAVKKALSEDIDTLVIKKLARIAAQDAALKELMQQSVHGSFVAVSYAELHKLSNQSAEKALQDIGI